MSRFEVGPVHVGVDLGGRDIGMSKQLLDDAKVGSAAEKMGGEAVAEKVGIDIGV